jgi:hypothetical protein
LVGVLPFGPQDAGAQGIVGDGFPLGLVAGAGGWGLDEVPGVLAEDFAQAATEGGDRVGVGGVPGGYHDPPPDGLEVLMYWRKCALTLLATLGLQKFFEFFHGS